MALRRKQRTVLTPENRAALHQDIRSGKFTSNELMDIYDIAKSTLDRERRPIENVIRQEQRDAKRNALLAERDEKKSALVPVEEETWVEEAPKPFVHHNNHNVKFRNMTSTSEQYIRTAANMNGTRWEQVVDELVDFAMANGNIRMIHGTTKG